MKPILFTDAVEVNDGSIRYTRDGFLVADAFVARTGIQVYRGFEVGKPELDTVRVYRPESEVFSDKALASYAHKPVTNDHPPEMVTADNWKKYGKGHTDGEVVRDGQRVRVSMMITDGETIADYKSGKKELSAGYWSELVFADGVTPDGEKYDAMQTNISQNHLALVSRARGGAALRIGDDNRMRNEPMDVKTRTVIVDGIPVESTDAAAAVIDTLQTRIAKANDANLKLTADAAATAKKHDEAMAAKDAEIAKLKSSALTDAQIDARAKARGELLATAAKLLPNTSFDGKSDGDVRRMVVTARLGDAAVKDKSDDYVNASFDIIAKDNTSRDPAAVIIAGKFGDHRQAVGDNGYAASVDSLDYRTANQKKEG